MSKALAMTDWIFNPVAASLGGTTKSKAADNVTVAAPASAASTDLASGGPANAATRSNDSGTTYSAAGVTGGSDSDSLGTPIQRKNASRTLLG